LQKSQSEIHKSHSKQSLTHQSIDFDQNMSRGSRRLTGMAKPDELNNKNMLGIKIPETMEPMFTQSPIQSQAPENMFTYGEETNSKGYDQSSKKVDTMDEEHFGNQRMRPLALNQQLGHRMHTEGSSTVFFNSMPGSLLNTQRDTEELAAKLNQETEEYEDLISKKEPTKANQIYEHIEDLHLDNTIEKIEEGIREESGIDGESSPLMVVKSQYQVNNDIRGSNHKPHYTHERNTPEFTLKGDKSESEDDGDGVV